MLFVLCSFLPCSNWAWPFAVPLAPPSPPLGSVRCHRRWRVVVGQHHCMDPLLWAALPLPTSQWQKDVKLPEQSCKRWCLVHMLCDEIARVIQESSLLTLASSQSLGRELYLPQAILHKTNHLNTLSDTCHRPKTSV